MVDLYINKLDFITLSQFERLTNQYHLRGEKKINIYLEESDEGDISVAFRLKDMIHDLIYNRGFQVNVYLTHAGNAGIVVLLAVPLKNRYMANYGSIKLEFTPLNDNQKDLEFINKFGEISLLIIPDFIRNLFFIKFMIKNTSYTFDDFEKETEYILNSKMALKTNLVADTFEIFLTKEEATYYAEYVKKNEKLIYILPEPYQSRMEQQVNYYHEMYITRNELYNVILDQGMAFINNK